MFKIGMGGENIVVIIAPSHQHPHPPPPSPTPCSKILLLNDVRTLQVIYRYPLKTVGKDDMSKCDWGEGGVQGWG